jgi:serine/threonine protein kinase
VTGVATIASPLAPGYKLDRYELLCPIADGGMASVWVARQRGKHGFEKLVAIKTILPKFAMDLRFQEMFLDEARIASRIEHVNVAQIFDLGEEHDILYLAMEYVEGDALSKLNRACQKNGVKIPTGVILKVLSDTCAGLNDAHELKDGAGRPLEIVHRDVSPHNILVSTKGIAKLIDFGIATARSRAGGETNSGVLKGKIQYMAPEQALGRPVDRRADIWAVGAILYSLLAGKPPYEADNPLATLHLLGSGRPPMPLPSSVHPAIAAIVRKALSFVPENRYAHAAEMRDALDRAMATSRAVTTALDVAAFAATHLGERVDRRRQAVEMALAAAAERQRAEERFQRTGERVPSNLLPGAPGGSSWPPIPPTSAPSLGAIRRDGPTLADAPASKVGSMDALSKMTARPSEPARPSQPARPSEPARSSEPPPHASSYATFGSAGALETSAQAPRSRRGPVAAVAGLVVAIAAAVSFTVLHARPADRSLTLPVAGSPPPIAMTAASGAPTTATPATAATASPSSSWSLMPTIAASSLPKANTPNFAPTPARHPLPLAPGPKGKKAGPDEAPAEEGTPGTSQAPAPEPAVPAPTAHPTATPKPARTIDDGF